MSNNEKIDKNYKFFVFSLRFGINANNIFIILRFSGAEKGFSWGPGRGTRGRGKMGAVGIEAEKVISNRRLGFSESPDSSRNRIPGKHPIH
jgi:hypothetical protein